MQCLVIINIRLPKSKLNIPSVLSKAVKVEDAKVKWLRWYIDVKKNNTNRVQLILIHNVPLIILLLV